MLYDLILGINHCETIDYALSPCLHGGDCVDEEEGFTCACATGWAGDKCQTSEIHLYICIIFYFLSIYLNQKLYIN